MNKASTQREKERLEALNALQIMHTDRLPEFDAVVETLAAIFDCPIALVSLVGADEQWFKAKCGIDVDGTPREVSFCQYALTSDTLFIVEDAAADERFKANPLVTNEPFIRFYAGCPLSVDGQNTLGTLCVIDRKPRTPTESQLQQLRNLGRVVEGLIKSNHAQRQAEDLRRDAEAQHLLADRKSYLLEEVTQASGVGGWEYDIDTDVVTWTDKTREIHEVDPDFQPTVDMALSFYAPDCRRQISDAVTTAIKNGNSWDLELPFITAKGRDIWVRTVGRAVSKNGRVARLIGAFQDITERKHSEQRVRMAEAVQRTTLETLREGVLVLNRAGRIQSFNSAAASLLGHTGDDLANRKVQDLDIECFAEHGRKDVDLLQRAARAPDTVNQHIAKVRLPGQKQFLWLRVDANATDSANEIGLDASIVSLADISETKRQAETMQIVFDNLPGGLVYYNDERRLTVCNKKFQELLQLPQEFIDRQAPLREVATYLAKRGDYGPGDPEELLAERFKLFDNPKPHMYERTSADGRFLEVRGIPLPNGGLIANFFDITERKRSEHLLRHSEAVQRTTLKALSEGILLLSHAGEIQSANPAAISLLGFESKQLIGRNVGDIDFGISCEIEGIGACNVPLVRAANDPASLQNVVARMAPTDGRPARWLRLSARAIDENQEFDLDGVVVSLADITETKQQADTLQSIFDNFPGGIVHYDETLRLASSNAEFCKLLNYPEDLINGKPYLFDFFCYNAERGDYGPGDPKELALQRYRKYDLKKPQVFERQTANGKFIETRSTPLPDGGLIHNFYDITERKLAEQAVQVAELVQRTTLEALNEGVLLLDRNGAILSSNPAAADMLGYPAESLTGVRVTELEVGINHAVDGQQINPFALTVEAPEQVLDLVAKLKPYGQSEDRWLRFNARLVDQGGDRQLDTVVLSLVDITEAKNQSDRMRVIFENVPGGFVYFDSALQLSFYNEETIDIIQVPRDVLDQKLHLLDYLKFNAERGDYGPGDPEQLALERMKQFPPDQPHAFERSTADGRHLDFRSTPLPGGGFIYNFFDVTQRRQMEEQLAENERQARYRTAELETILANMRQGVSVFDKRGRLTLWNKQYIEIFGKPDGDVREGVTLIELIEAEKARGEFDGDVQQHVMDLMIRLSSGEVVRSKFRHPNGKIISAVHAPMPDGGWIGTHEDVTQRELAAEKIEYAAHHDTLTGLGNRTLFNAKLEETLDKSEATGTCADLLLLDLDKFKPVNDTYGHDVGDELLKIVADRLRDCVRSSDLIARLGGDEFGIILGGTGPSNERTAEIAERIVRKLQAPFPVFDHLISIGVSVGISPITGDIRDPSTIIKRADLALYAVKHSGRNAYRFFEQENTPAAKRA
ncbi:PAS-domain containing protein [Roseibium sediminicola]|uniref:PAS-domain containing protein n=1 Tax=Roseibium sediminicola TaxID=2933272 RepID=A0ABT0GVF7_9HYPH|nr:PAS-domain containing protein [Roseibium sp. CAU 1639]MCK7613418.1 PAS-domain containing protein [Roseibium sp. CAU 1639]